jgi:hypothetical protein
MPVLLPSDCSPPFLARRNLTARYDERKSTESWRHDANTGSRGTRKRQWLPSARQDPFALSARDATREEALAKLRAKIQTRLKNGTEIVGLEIDPRPHPLAEFVGMFKDDPMFDDWQRAIVEYRRQVDNDPDYQ